MKRQFSYIDDGLSRLLADERLRAIRQALGADAELHIVGGALRDLLLGNEIADVDVATALEAEEVERRLAASSIRTVPTGIRHQTVLAIPLPEELGIEITSFRGPETGTAAERPVSDDICQDLALRDFTINALAYSLDQDRLLDPLDGSKDIEIRLVRAVGDARTRFAEDPLRLLRMVRFAAMDGFSLDALTFVAAVESCPRLTRVSIERIRTELELILLSPRPALGLRLLQLLGFFRLFLPEIEACFGFEQNRFHKTDVFHHTLDVVARTKPVLTLRLAALLHDIGKPETLSVDPDTGERHFFRHEVIGRDLTLDMLSRLRFSKTLARETALLVETHMRPLKLGASGMRRLLRDTGELFELWRDLKEADALACKIDETVIKEELRQFDHSLEEVRKGPKLSPLKSLAVNGHDLIARGIAPGPHMGKLLLALHERVLDDPGLNTKERLLSLLDDADFLDAVR